MTTGSMNFCINNCNIIRPRIAISAGIEELRQRQQTTLPVAYANAIEDAGGIPVIIPVTRQGSHITDIARFADGFLFSGGDDIRPGYYDEEPLSALTLSPDERTEFEIALLKEVIYLEKPVLGICLGSQLINVTLGGSLYQDIPTQIAAHLNHRTPHNISIKDGTLLYRIFEEVKEISVTSGHHQSVKSTGEGLVVSALSPDSVVEAIEMTDHPFFVGVQWHPERDLDDNYSRILFKEFVNKAKENM